MKKLWITFVLVLVVSFVVLGWIGTRIYQEAPPIANQVVTTEGKGKLFLARCERDAGPASPKGNA
jgi:nitric oxide reductase large subunit